MSTQKETIQFILEKLGHPPRFTARSMFGEYALYADEKVVALVCDNLLFVKIVPASQDLEPVCEKGHPFPGAKEHYIIEEVQLSTLPNLPGILFAVAEGIKTKKRKRGKSSK
jgi:hypothetical protein